MAMLAGTGQFAFAADTDGAEAVAGVEGEDYAAGEVIVVFKEGTTNSKAGEIIADNDALLETKTRVDGNIVALASIDEDTTVSEAIGDIEENSRVEYAQPNYRYETAAADPYLSPSAGKYYQKQFAMTKAMEAWEEVESEPHASTVVAVIDTGIDIDHADLKENLVSQGSYMNFALGKSFEMTEDTGDHGTHVAGIIAAEYGNGKGGSGIASGTDNDLVKLLPVGASVDGEGLYTIDIVNGMNYAAAKGAKVINMSFGYEARDRVEGEAIKALCYNKGIVFVSAAGNERTDEYCDPSDMKEVISVCNYDADVTDGVIVEGTTKGVLKTDSNYGIAKDISAPGEYICSTIPDGLYGIQSGTSMSSPIVAGVCAMMLDAAPDLTPAQVRNILCATAEKDDVITNNQMGYGRLDAEAAVRAAKEASADVPAGSIEMKAKSATIDKDSSAYADAGYGMEALVLPAESLAPITWSSDNEEVATVDENGIVTGKKAGSCYITASAGDQSDSCKVTVRDVNDPASISIEDAPDDMTVGEQYDGIDDFVTVTGTDPGKTVTNDEIYWKSGDTDVVLADSGTMIAVGSGTAKVTVSTYNGKQASFNVTVHPSPSSISITRSSSWVRYGTSYTFGATLYAYTNIFSDKAVKVTDKNAVRWSLGEPGGGTINASTGRFTPSAEGLRTGYVYIRAASARDSLSGGKVERGKKVTIIKRNYSGKSSYALKRGTVKRRTAVVKWKKIPAADRYVIQRAYGSKGNFKTIKTVKSSVVLKNSGTMTYIDKKLKNNRTYRYRVRAQFLENGTRKSFGYSNTVKIKTKK